MDTRHLKVASRMQEWLKSQHRSNLFWWNLEAYWQPDKNASLITSKTIRQKQWHSKILSGYFFNGCIRFICYNSPTYERLQFPLQLLLAVRIDTRLSGPEPCAGLCTAAISSYMTVP
jgi:hypothetical protein